MLSYLHKGKIPTGQVPCHRVITSTLSPLCLLRLQAIQALQLPFAFKLFCNKIRVCVCVCVRACVRVCVCVRALFIITGVWHE